MMALKWLFINTEGIGGIQLAHVWFAWQRQLSESSVLMDDVSMK
jgi:hypothetical protein